MNFLALENLLKSLLHNLGVTAVALGVAYVGTRLDVLFGIARFDSRPSLVAGGVLLAAGFLLRLWATSHFYRHRMSVVRLTPQNALLTSGPYGYSRNPLYLGGNAFMFSGAALLLGTVCGLLLTAAHLPLIDRFIRREERQLEQQFGEDWLRYKSRVRRWL